MAFCTKHLQQYDEQSGGFCPYCGNPTQINPNITINPGSNPQPPTWPSEPSTTGAPLPLRGYTICQCQSSSPRINDQTERYLKG